MIPIFECGSQVTHNIARRLRELEVHAVIVAADGSMIKAEKGSIDGFVLSGGQYSVYKEGSPRVSMEVLEQEIPVLGICYGMQLITYMLGGKVSPSDNKEFGPTKVEIVEESPLFRGIDEKLFKGLDKRVIQTWMSHGDVVETPPDGFKVTAVSENGHIAAMEKDGVYCVQFHPELDGTDYGRIILKNFTDICNARKDWQPGDNLTNIENGIRGQVGDGFCIGAVSGGVDSTTMAAIMNQALGDQFLAITVNNGLLRLDEEKEVVASLAGLGINFVYVDASARFLKALEGVTDPDEERKIIGNEFIYVFQEHAKRLGDVKYLAQGTLYPDVIESIPAFGHSSKIKRHHNVGGLPDHMDVELVEPFREMYKDEVRDIGRMIGVPDDIVDRHPFPGPGLAIRIMGEITPERLRVVREADAIYLDEIRKAGVYNDIAQAFATVIPMGTVGVKGDEGTYEGQNIIGLRAVTTNDFMDADWYRFDHDLLQRISNRILNEVQGVGRVFYDTTPKPPGTVELL